MMQSVFKSYDPEILPEGFSYPQAYLDLEKTFRPLKYFMWWLLDSRSELGQLAWELRIHYKTKGWKYFSDTDPIPFARDGDWAAFFNGNDHSGNPAIVVADLGNKENSYKMANFEVWYDNALRDAGLK